VLQVAHGPRHPRCAKAADEFLAVLASLDGLFEQITLLAAADQPRPEIVVEGVFAEPVPLLVCSEQADEGETAVKLVEYLHAHRLVSLAIRRGLDREHLGVFLQFAASSVAGPDSLAPAPGNTARLADQLPAAGVFTISALGHEEVIPAQRGLSWRLRLALSCLARSLRDVAPYARATGQDARQAREVLLHQVLQSAGDQSLVIELVRHADLTCPIGAEVETSALQAALLAALSPAQVRALAITLLSELQGGTAWEASDHSHQVRAMELFKLCLTPLAAVLDEEALAVLNGAVDRRLVSPAELPDNARALLGPEKLLALFFKSPEAQLARLRAVTDADSFRAYGSQYAAILDELVKRRHYAWARTVADALGELGGASHPAAVRRLAGAVLETVARRAVLDRMVTHFAELSGEERAHLHRLLEHVRKPAAGELLARLHENLDEPLRASVRALLVHVGEAALPAVLAGLRRKQRPELVRDFLLVLAGLRDPAGYDVAAGLRSAEDPRVRQAALLAMVRTGGARAETELCAALADPDPAVRASAVEGLTAVASRATAFFDFLTRLFDGELRPGLRVLAQRGGGQEIASQLAAYFRLQQAGCAALVAMAQKGDADLSAFEPLLAKALRDKLGGGLVGFALRLGRKNDEREEVERERTAAAMALVTALAWFGGRTSLAALLATRGKADPEVERLAARAYREITARLGGQS
jgi:hypothetical protein